MIEIKKLNQYYGQSHTLRDLSLNVLEGDCIAVMGRNGVGKTTLVECMIGLLKVEPQWVLVMCLKEEEFSHS